MSPMTKQLSKLRPIVFMDRLLLSGGKSTFDLSHYSKTECGAYIMIRLMPLFSLLQPLILLFVMFLGIPL